MDPQAFDIVERVIQFLEERGFQYVLAGGWAAFAYGSRVASADTDVFMREPHAEEATRLVETELRVTTGPGGRFEVLALDQLNRILGPDPELGEPDRGYVPAKLFEGRVQRVPLVLPRTTLTTNVPAPPEFTFTKLKALHNRELAYRALRDPGVMAIIPPADRGEIREKTESYYAGKAGKDLFDSAHMLSHHAQLDDVLRLMDQHGLRDDLEPPLRHPDPYVRKVGLGLATDPKTRAWLEQNTR